MASSISAIEVSCVSAISREVMLLKLARLISEATVDADILSGFQK